MTSLVLGAQEPAEAFRRFPEPGREPIGTTTGFSQGCLGMSDKVLVGGNPPWPPFAKGGRRQWHLLEDRLAKCVISRKRESSDFKGVGQDKKGWIPASAGMTALSKYHSLLPPFEKGGRRHWHLLKDWLAKCTIPSRQESGDPKGAGQGERCWIPASAGMTALGKCHSTGYPSFRKRKMKGDFENIKALSFFPLQRAALGNFGCWAFPGGTLLSEATIQLVLATGNTGER